MSLTKILIVEDEVIVAMDLRQQLENFGYRVVGNAVSGAEAIEHARAFSPELVLMDIRLRGSMDGIETAAEIRRRFDLPVIFLTAHSDKATLGRAKLTEPFGYLLKPVEGRELQIAIEISLYKHKMDSKVRRMERWLATTLSSICDGVITTDLNGCVNYMNPVAEHLSEWSLDESSGRLLDDIFPLFNAETGEPVTISFQNVMEEGVVIGLEGEKVLKTRSGRIIAINDTIAPLRDENDKITGIVLVFRDVTAQNEARAALRRSEERLRQVEKIEALGQLAGGVAHDFNNLMTVVSGYSSLLLIDRRQDDPDRTKIEQILRAAENAAVLTRQLLAFSRKQVLHTRILDINEIISGKKNMLSRLVGEDILLELSLAPTVSPVKVDPVQIDQVLINLAVNARDAMPRGGKLLISTETVELNENYARSYPDIQPGVYTMMAVRDTGTGMDETTQAKIFEPFFTTKDVGKGTGLGLSTVYGIVKQSGGHITVDSTPGRGATFKICLPAAEQPVTEREIPAAPPMRGGSETIMVVEDNTSVRKLVVTLLRHMGYKVLEAGTGTEALRLHNGHDGPLHLLITDIVMPEMSGQEVAEQLIALSPELRVIYMSGYAEAAIASSGLLRPGAGFLPKPFTPEDLSRKVRSMLGTKEE